MSSISTDTTPTARAASSESGFGAFFRYHGWLSPGVRLFRRLAFPAKSAWVTGALLVPLVMALCFLAGAAREQVATAQAELLGLRYVRAMLDLSGAADARRRSVTLGSSDIDERQKQVQAAFAKLQSLQQADGKAMALEPAFNELKKRHEVLLQSSSGGAAEDRFASQTEMSQAVLVLLRAVGDGSQLALDPDLDTYHLMNVTVLRGPRLVEALSSLQALGAYALKTKDTRELSQRMRSHIERWSAEYSLLQGDVANSYAAALQATPEIAALGDFKRAEALSAAFVSSIEQNILGLQVTGELGTFDAAGKEAVEAQTKLHAALLDRLAQRLQARTDRVIATLAWQLGVTALCVALAFYLMLAFYRVMMGGLREVSGHLEQITQGNLTTSPTPWGKDEAAQLMVTMGQMQESLRRIVGIVLNGADQVKSASEEISAASRDLSQRTEGAAAHLQETASSMEQISATVRQTSDTVVGAMALARENASAATRGGSVVSEVVRTMQGINESSQRIGEIIGVIDGIAFQTNILALNAAVEAARAGEQGRGFAVVASEVRALAGRSAAAAREIKTLIGASIEQAGKGNRVAAQAGETINEVVNHAGRIAQLMEQISTAAHDQSAGVELVGSAVQDLDRSTQQNAALVEQTSAAAHSLADQSLRLSSEVSFFRIA